MTAISMLLLLASLSAALILVSADEEPATPIVCDPDKVYNPCGSACPPTCLDPNGGACNKKCVPGCFCKDGYVADGERCIDKKLCDSCTGNTTYTSCGSMCQDTCTRTYKPTDPCILSCFIGCKCKPGYVYLDDNKEKCILPQDCPKV
ncbi:cysteine-rich venom protein 6-like [Dendropsophus ebraccatus]|uniref:cysteine-rich venom protein 6-like n=1 Tax=Dendropsophus ebraccatus TaxID=150705 RepID=UPI00383225A4